jgi:hypothetical protein
MLRVIIVGLGPIGLNVAKAVRDDPGMKLVGAVDLDPNKIGQMLDSSRVKIVADISQAIKTGADVAILTTTSYFGQIAPTLRQCMKHKLHVVSSCEEMSFPSLRNKSLASAIDAEAKNANVALLGTGVNPGFVMDLLPVVLSSMVTQVNGVKVIRRLDAGKRRLPLQAKVGATMTRAHFINLARQKKIGHMGIAESVAMIAAGLGREAKLKDIRITLEPVIAKKRTQSLLGPIEIGMVSGMRNTAKWLKNGLKIELDLTMAVGAEDAQDRVELNGPVTLTAVIPGSTPGDSATVAALINCARLLPTVSPGLKTMLDLPPASARRQ